MNLGQKMIGWKRAKSSKGGFIKTCDWSRLCGVDSLRFFYQSSHSTELSIISLCSDRWPPHIPPLFLSLSVVRFSLLFSAVIITVGLSLSSLVPLTCVYLSIIFFSIPLSVFSATLFLFNVSSLTCTASSLLLSQLKMFPPCFFCSFSYCYLHHQYQPADSTC